jgi:hypothetical protein
MVERDKSVTGALSRCPSSLDIGNIGEQVHSARKEDAVPCGGGSSVVPELPGMGVGGATGVGSGCDPALVVPFSGNATPSPATKCKGLAQDWQLRENFYGSQRILICGIYLTVWPQIISNIRTGIRAYDA